MNYSLFPETVQENTVRFPTDLATIAERMNSVNPLQYSKTRNFINGAVTYLSPYISRGVISVKQVMESVLQKGLKPYQVQKFLQELAWREYYQRVWQAIGQGIWKDIKQPQADVQHQQMVAAVDNACTGIETIDEKIKGLYSTGYMHNHVRMYTASLVCNMAKAHWMQPAIWMYYHLLDGDVASNNCSWQWVAGDFASKKYYFNQDNVNKYSFSQQRQTFLDKSYQDLTVMPVPDILKATIDLSLNTTLPETPFPAIDTNKPTLIYNSYNLDAAWRNNEDVNRVLLLEPSHFATYPVSQKVIGFIIDLSKNIEGIQVNRGEVQDLAKLYENTPLQHNCIIAKEHPLFAHYPGAKDSRDWMFPQVTGYFNSFFSFWKKCEKYLE